MHHTYTRTHMHTMQYNTTPCNPNPIPCNAIHHNTLQHITLQLQCIHTHIQASHITYYLLDLLCAIDYTVYLTHSRSYIHVCVCIYITCIHRYTGIKPRMSDIESRKHIIQHTVYSVYYLTASHGFCSF